MFEMKSIVKVNTINLSELKNIKERRSRLDRNLHSSRNTKVVNPL